MTIPERPQRNYSGKVRSGYKELSLKIAAGEVEPYKEFDTKAEANNFMTTSNIYLGAGHMSSRKLSTGRYGVWYSADMFAADSLGRRRRPTRNQMFENAVDDLIQTIKRGQAPDVIVKAARVVENTMRSL